jgi:hypothetical protein
MDFIVVLPKSGNKLVIIVLVNNIFKYSHFCALQQPFTTSTVAQNFMDTIFKIHGMHPYIVSDRDPTFTSNFWKELSRLEGTNFISALPIILTLMDKLNLTTIVWEHSFYVFHLTEKVGSVVTPI